MTLLIVVLIIVCRTHVTLFMDLVKLTLINESLSTATWIEHLEGHKFKSY